MNIVGVFQKVKNEHRIDTYTEHNIASALTYT
jgi:hypothetical protein